MQKLYTRFSILAVALLCLLSNYSKAAEGDTTKIRVHDAVHMDWYGQYLQWGVFPQPGTTFRRINLDLTIGCPPTGCSDWDYTVLVEARHKTGQFDSTLTPAPLYTVNGNSPDSIFSNLNQAYITFYDTLNMITDSSVAGQFWIMTHNNPNDPFAVSDSDYVYPGNYYNYYFDNSGNVIDSILVGYDQTWINSVNMVYVVFEIVELQEIARVITPYGGYYGLTWKNTWHFDITDLAPLLQDSVEIRAFYSGWSDGFAITLDFEFIEGTPPRTPLQIRNVYKGSFPFGNAANPIENYLIPKSFDIDSSEVMSMLRVIPSGHGAGTQNCAEFCAKNYKVKVDGIQQFQQLVWRTDCGMNPLMHQAGTWIYDRANWCPGEKVIIREHELTPVITPGTTVSLDLDFDTYTNSSTNGASYILSTQLITYSAPNKLLDASIEEIIAPNYDMNYSRFNPICNNPKVVIRNTGSTILNSLVITYGIKGAPQSTYTWNGNLAFNQYEEVQLGGINWSSSTNTPDEFEVVISDPNGNTDQYAFNDTLRSYLNFPPEFPSSFVLLVKTNNAYWETSYNIKDDMGNIILINPPLSANTFYYDTLSLTPGCYEFNLNDSGKDGLSFFANNDGTGYARFLKASTTGALKYLEADFGTSLSFKFTVGYLLSEPAIELEPALLVYPNPASESFTLDLNLPQNENITITITDMSGKLLLKEDFKNVGQIVKKFTLNDSPAGLYLVRVTGDSFNLVRKLMWNN